MSTHTENQGTPLPKSSSTHQFATGAKRGASVAGDSLPFPLRFDLLLANTAFMTRLAATYGEGAMKYGDENWKQGMPEKSLINHMMAHLMQHIVGDRSEDHLAHMTWNAMALMWVQENRPDLLDLVASAAKGTEREKKPMDAGNFCESTFGDVPTDRVSATEARHPAEQIIGTAREADLREANLLASKEEGRSSTMCSIELIEKCKRLLREQILITPIEKSVLEYIIDYQTAPVSIQLTAENKYDRLYSSEL